MFIKAIEQKGTFREVKGKGVVNFGRQEESHPGVVPQS
jgi:hypothetical protein